MVLCAFTHGKLNRPQDDTVVILIVGTLAFSIGSILAQNTKEEYIYSKI